MGGQLLHERDAACELRCFRVSLCVRERSRLTLQESRARSGRTATASRCVAPSHPYLGSRRWQQRRWRCTGAAQRQEGGGWGYVNGGDGGPQNTQGRTGRCNLKTAQRELSTNFHLAPAAAHWYGKFQTRLCTAPAPPMVPSSNQPTEPTHTSMGCTCNVHSIVLGSIPSPVSRNGRYLQDSPPIIRGPICIVPRRRPNLLSGARPFPRRPELPVPNAPTHRAHTVGGSLYKR